MKRKTVIIIVILILVVIAGCSVSPERMIVGKWKRVDLVLKDDDGLGKNYYGGLCFFKDGTIYGEDKWTVRCKMEKNNEEGYLHRQNYTEYLASLPTFEQDGRRTTRGKYKFMDKNSIKAEVHIEAYFPNHYQLPSTDPNYEGRETKEVENKVFFWKVEFPSSNRIKLREIRAGADPFPYIEEYERVNE